ncbi:MAG: hypothetical protein K8F59_07600 [Rhodobacteraceae bacterium]|nr:hypothetical protein [Paracoccaceae bacterium]
MSGFLRPELKGQLIRWAEPVGAGAVALLGAVLIWRGFSRYDDITLMIGIALLLLGAAAFAAAYRRAQFHRDADGPGVVEVTERQITYMTPHGGGSVDIEALTRIEIRTLLEHGRSWVLKQSEGPALYIPIDAYGVDKLFDAFAVLPGLEPARLIAALKAGGDQRDVVWRGPPGFRALT